MLLAHDLRYSYVQEYVIVEIFCLALWYFQYSVTCEQTAWCVFNNYFVSICVKSRTHILVKSKGIVKDGGLGLGSDSEL